MYKKYFCSCKIATNNHKQQTYDEHHPVTLHSKYFVRATGKTALPFHWTFDSSALFSFNDCFINNHSMFTKRQKTLRKKRLSHNYFLIRIYSIIYLTAFFLFQPFQVHGKCFNELIKNCFVRKSIF